MAVYSGSYDPAYGPLLNVKVANPKTGVGLVFPLLIDTGADDTSVSATVISNLSLRHYGNRATIATTGQAAPRRTFLVDLAIEFDNGTSWQKHGFEVAEFLAENTMIRGIVGRDILCRGTFTMRSDGRFTFEL